MNACAGWAGDLLQIGGNIKVTNDITEINYFEQPNVLKKFICDKPGDLDEYNLFQYNYKTKISKKINKGESLGISLVDLCQEEKFGKFDGNSYGLAHANAFETKINELINLE
ncbi:hypothetical protein [Anaerosacchariphilus polymeriproducens]|uniref:Uncharacterized protein n=1 Tax=Anaerosacchariphilus polymeriproducens TaxID=1812858 RepID=A0A371AS07_9FIRM|nr:hypothetical protein [Anaerosacchariphilus polymeriproducens]RDU22344.1 hypothetical protein DWV06_13685 [Anaerosacchariphilus polymeriproducens]